MKRFLSIFLIVWAGIFLYAVPRNLVVVEVATGTWCQYCPGAAMGCHDLLNNGHPVAIIKNHNGDSFANVYSNARNSFYGVSGFPTAFFDGLNPTVGGSNSSSMYSNYLPKVNARMQVPSHYTISAVGTQSNNQFQVTVTVTKPEDDTNTNIKLHAVLTESNIPFVWFNQTTVENVNRLMIPDQNGTPVNLNTGESTTINLTFTPDASWNIANCEMVFFLQNMTSKEILQGVKYSLPGLVGAYPVSVDHIDFPQTFIGGSSTVPITITNFLAEPVTGTISINNFVFSSSITNFTIPGTQSLTVDVTFTPTAATTYTGTLTITSNLYNHPVINIPLTGTGFLNHAPTATNVVITGPPVIYQQLTASYTFSDIDGDEEGSSIYQWYRVIGQPHPIEGANQLTYTPTEEDLNIPLGFRVVPVDEHGMNGIPVMSAFTIPIQELPPPRNLHGTYIPPNTVQLTWEPPLYFDVKGLVGYRLFRDELPISTITNPSILSFSDVGVPNGTHQYWVCTLFNNPMMLSGPSNVVTIVVGTAIDDPAVPAVTSVSVYPNPCMGNVSFSIQTKSNVPALMSVYNVKGQLVKQFNTITDAIGNAILFWDGTDNQGRKVDSGVYYYRVEADKDRISGKLLMIK